jgi:putative ABC transport system ATP-binding protein
MDICFMADQSTLVFKSVSKVFQDGNRALTVLDNVDLSLGTGEKCVVFGPSGSGKTTLLALGAGLDRPTSGQVELTGQSLSTHSEDELALLRRRAVGFVFQSFHLIPSLTALENVLVPAELSGKRNRKNGEDLLALLGLHERFQHYPSQLSGGEQQRVSLARAFINHPKILFADEPTGNLDAENAEKAMEAIFQLNKEFGTTVLFVTHDRSLADRFDRTIRLQNGRIQGAI